MAVSVLEEVLEEEERVEEHLPEHRYMDVAKIVEGPYHADVIDAVRVALKNARLESPK